MVSNNKKYGPELTHILISIEGYCENHMTCLLTFGVQWGIGPIVVIVGLILHQRIGSI
jgi:hypothetical protein